MGTEVPATSSTSLAVWRLFVDFASNIYQFIPHCASHASINFLGRSEILLVHEIITVLVVEHIERQCC